jgi:hypothetical protein
VSFFRQTDRSNYQQIPTQDDALNLEENERKASTNASPSPQISVLKLRSLHLTIFFMTFSFYAICVLHTFSPHWFLNPSSSSSLYDIPVHRFLQGEDQQQQSSPSSSSSSSCTTGGVYTSVVVGGIAGVVVVGGAFLVIGLTPFGPIAGGLFAANVGSGLVAGGLMATIQSAAMTGTAYATGAGVGAAAAIGKSCGR